MCSQVWFVVLPFPLQKDELRKLHSPADDWDTSQGLLENNVDAAVHSIGVCYPPQV